MKTIALVVGLVLLAADSSVPEAEQLFASERYQESATEFTRLADATPLQGRVLRYNRAQSLWMLDSIEAATSIYQLLLPQTEDPVLASRMLCHIGLQQVQQSRLSQALNSFRDALLRDPGNEIARFNYELLKRRMEDNPPPPYQPPPPIPPSPNSRPGPPPPTEHLGLIQEDTLMNPAQVEGLLQRLMNRPELYLQQLRKRATDPARFSDRPDW